MKKVFVGLSGGVDPRSRAKLATGQVAPSQGRRVFVGLSGGVDSAVSAALLKQAGYDVTGVFIKVWHPDFLPCTWREERRDAMRVALHLGIPFIFLDFEEEYKKGVADYMIDEYKAGRTPNPDVLCNREIKFGAFWNKAKEMGADYIATGHYARIAKDTERKTTEVNSLENLPNSRADALQDAFSTQYLMLTGKDLEKDQSYFLWTLTQEDLAHTLFPVGDLEKSEVRRLAEKFDLLVAEKKDSQGICFMGEVSLEEFLSHFVSTKPGDVLDTKGNVVGTHRGALYYTIGERHGFEVTKKGPDTGAFYVVSKDMKANTITVSSSAKEILSLSPKVVSLRQVNWITEPEGERLEARIRYRGNKIPAKLVLKGKRLAVEFKEAERGLSVGQSIVFYKDDQLLGGAVLDEVIE